MMVFKHVQELMLYFDDSIILLKVLCKVIPLNFLKYCKERRDKKYDFGLTFKVMESYLLCCKMENH